MSAQVEDVLRAARGAYRDVLEARFWTELGEWSKKSGIEMMGTDAIEAHLLVNIVDETLRDPKVIKGIYARLAEYAPEQPYGGPCQADPKCWKRNGHDGEHEHAPEQPWSGDLRAKVEGLREPKSESQYWDAWNNAISHVLAIIPEGAVLVTEETLAAALMASPYLAMGNTDDERVAQATRVLAAAILRHLRETST